MIAEPVCQSHPRARLDLHATGRRIENFGELIDALAELDLELATALVALDLQFPLFIELELIRTPLGPRIIGS